jgi:Zn-dependent protease with chaperone function
MDITSTILSAIIGASAAMAVAILNSYWSRKREYESDWRKIKLDLYKDFTFALAGLVDGRQSDASKVTYMDAIHSLMLIASPEVIRCLNDFNSHQLDKQYLTPLFIAIRSDIKLKKDNSDHGLEFQTFSFFTTIKNEVPSA